MKQVHSKGRNKIRKHSEAKVINTKDDRNKTYHKCKTQVIGCKDSKVKQPINQDIKVDFKVKFYRILQYLIMKINLIRLN